MTELNLKPNGITTTVRVTQPSFDEKAVDSPTSSNGKDVIQFTEPPITMKIENNIEESAAANIKDIGRDEVVVEF